MKLFLRPVILILGLLLNSQSQGQAFISGVINNYAIVNSVDFCNNLAVIELTTGFSIGERVLLIQMQGATADSSDTNTFGNIISYNNAGKFELLTIADISSNIVTFEETIQNNYDPFSGIQMVEVPQYTDVVVDNILTANIWDGGRGGVLIFEASGTVTFNADIDVSGTGFRAGGNANDPACFGGGSGFDGYRCNFSDNCGGLKGEGIALIGSYGLGRGAPGNAGGGGNDHKTGGGGGSNYAAGGVGGERLNESVGDCPGDFPGIEGYNLDYSSNSRVFMGGGGGSGDMSDNDGSAGGEGGGIVIIIADNIIGNGFSILANGETPAAVAGTDGAGGGGGGGSVLLQVNTITSNLNVETLGGDGGDVDNGMDPDLCVGPGGGGGGGVLWTSGTVIPPSISHTATGGQAGLTLNANAPAVCLNSSNGADNGMDGSAITGLSVVSSNETYIELTVEAFTDTVICFGDIVGLTAVGTATGDPIYTWSDGSTGPDISVSPDGSTLYTITVTDNRGCSIIDEVFVEVIGVVSVSAQPSTQINPGQTVILIADTTENWTYSWEPDVDNPSEPITSANPFETTQYCVTATHPTGCVSTDCVTIEVDFFLNIPNAFTPNSDGLNDIFRLPDFDQCEEIVEFKVFGRWGELIYDYDINPLGWDGTDGNGKAFPLGSYVYIGSLRCEDELKKLTGTITLLR